MYVWKHGLKISMAGIRARRLRNTELNNGVTNRNGLFWRDRIRPNPQPISGPVAVPRFDRPIKRHVNSKSCIRASTRR